MSKAKHWEAFIELRGTDCTQSGIEHDNIEDAIQEARTAVGMLSERERRIATAYVSEFETDGDYSWGTGKSQIVWEGEDE